MQFIMFTDIPEIASFIDECGVERVMVDRETKGKQERQKGFNMPINKHSFQDAKRVKKAVKKASVMLRINPLHEKTAEEVQKSIDAGVDYIMLPYFHHQDEVKKFLDIVDGRVKTSLLLETASAVARVEQIMELRGIDEVHFGLNDLRISFRCDFLFEPLAGGMIDFLCLRAKRHGFSYGIGGVGRIGQELLCADSIIKEHVRLGSERVILSRAFHGDSSTVDELCSYIDFKEELMRLREVERVAVLRTESQVEQDRIDFCKKVNSVSQEIKNKSL